MANNEKVSSLLQLFESEIQSNDVFLVTDTSVRESKKLAVGDLLTYFEQTGSYNAVTSIYAVTASYILASGVNGIIPVSNNSSQSISSSFSNKSISSSYSQTSSYSLFANSANMATAVNSNTSSFLQYNGFPNGTSSFSLTSLLSENSAQSYFLFYNGQPNGTASWSIYSSNSQSSSFSITSSNSNTSSYALTTGVYTPVKAWAEVTWSVGAAFPWLYYNNNISSIQYLNSFVGPGGLTNLNQFGVAFQIPLVNTNYTLLGVGYQAFSDVVEAGVLLHPIYSNRTVNGFTMSVSTPVGINWYNSTSGSYPNDTYSWANFQILGQ